VVERSAPKSALKLGHSLRTGGVTCTSWLNEIAEKSLLKRILLNPAMPDFLKIHLIHFSITLSGHVSLVFQGSFLTFCPVLAI